MIQIDPRSRVPIYEQIIDTIKEMSLNGTLKPDEKLPSVRELSKEMTINPNTIQKAYKELERQGIVYVKIGQGSFINSDIEARNKEEKMSELKEDLKKVIIESVYLGLSKEDFIEIIDNIYEDSTKMED